jgi:hypothetical protein
VAESIGEDLRLLKKKLSSLAVSPKRSTAAARRERDSRHVLKENDGRRRRGAAVERPEQINFKCRGGTKDRFRAVAEAMNRSMIGVLERALELVEIEAGIGS